MSRGYCIDMSGWGRLIIENHRIVKDFVDDKDNFMVWVSNIGRKYVDYWLLWNLKWEVFVGQEKIGHI